MSSWLSKKIQRLTAESQIIDVDRTAVYGTGSWAALKLLFLQIYLRSTYIPIIRPRFRNVYYVDLMTGPGVAYLAEPTLYLNGSPLIAAQYGTAFNKLFFVEKNEKSKIALERRLSLIKPPQQAQQALIGKRKLRTINYSVFGGDCNTAIDSILSAMKTYSAHYLAFVDMEGMDVSWETIEKLLSKTGEYGDVILNLQMQSIIRDLPHAKKRASHAETFTRFFGTDEWRRANDERALLELYTKRLAKHRPVQRTITVKSGGAYHYDLVFATRETGGDNPWLRVVDNLKRNVETNTGETVEKVLAVITGKSRDLSFFIPNPDQMRDGASKSVKLDKFGGR